MWLKLLNQQSILLFLNEKLIPRLKVLKIKNVWFIFCLRTS